jgi:phosphate-selective porin OprO and OprP
MITMKQKNSFRNCVKLLALSTTILAVKIPYAIADSANAAASGASDTNIEQRLDSLQSSMQSEINRLNEQAAEIKALKAQSAALAQAASVSKQQLAANKLQLEAEKKYDQSIETSIPAQDARNTWYLGGHDVIPEFVSNDGNTEFHLGGSIQLDGAIGSVPHQGGYSGGADFHRILLLLTGVYDQHYVWKLQFNFANTVSPLGTLLDAYAGYQTKIHGVNSVFLAGNQFVPFSIQLATADLPFLENDIGYTLWVPPRQIGVTGQQWQKHWNIWYGVLGQSPTKQTTVGTGNSQATLAAAGTINFINTPGHLLAIRDSIMYNKFNANEPTFQSTPDLSVYGTDLITTGALNVQGDLNNSPRIDFQDNRLILSAEYFWTQTQNFQNVFAAGTHRKLDPSFSSWDVEGSYFLTNDYQPYSTQATWFTGVTPTDPVTRGGIGAVQLLARVDEANLNDARLGIHGGNETNLTIGLNWWPVEAVRIMVNYVKVLPVGGLAATNQFRGASPSIAAARLVLKF